MHTLFIGNLTPQDQAVVRIAAGQWEFAHEPIELIVEPCPSVFQHCFTRGRHGTDLGASIRDNDWITVDPSVTGPLFHHVALHEFGHLIGIREHTVHGVMSVSEFLVELTEHDIEACRAAAACD